MNYGFIYQSHVRVYSWGSLKLVGFFQRRMEHLIKCIFPLTSDILKSHLVLFIAHLVNFEEKHFVAFMLLPHRPNNDVK